MKALVQHAYGAPADVLHFADVDLPTVGPDDVLVKVMASSANPWDWHYIRGEPLLMRPALGGVRRPKFLIPGGDVAGTVEQVGSAVAGFEPGDSVYGFGHGAFAEYVSVPHARLARKPVNLSYEQAAAVPLGAVTALQGLRAGHVARGQRVLIIGASGGVGTFAVQIARHLGTEVTGVCSTGGVARVRALGADDVIDYTSDDVLAAKARYDLVLQLGGTYSPLAVRSVLAPEGVLVQSYGDGSRWIGPLGSIVKAKVVNPFVGVTLKSFVAAVTTEALEEITDLIESGHISPTIDREYSLVDAAQAVSLVESGHPIGKVTIVVR